MRRMTGLSLALMITGWTTGMIAGCAPTHEPTEVQRDLLGVARKAERRHDHAAARDLYLELAESGIAKAQIALAEMLREGRGGPVDKEDAARWYLAAAEQEDPVAMREAARIYAAGEGVQKDTAEAGRWYARAAEVGDEVSRFELALLVLEEGSGREKMAISALTTSATNGFVPAQLELAERYATGDVVVRDPGKATRWYTIAATALTLEAERGDLGAKAKLADLYREGTGVPQDVALAVTLYEEVAAAGRMSAIVSLARLYDRGAGSVAPDPQRAAAYYERAADAGHASSAYDLGKKLYRGNGIPKDLSRAARFLDQAVELGDNRALIYLGDLYKDPSELQDLKKAAAYYRRSGLAGEPKGYFKLAELHDRGRLDPSDPSLALALYELATEAGYRRGKARADRLRRRLDPAERNRASQLRQEWLAVADRR